MPLLQAIEPMIPSLVALERSELPGLAQDLERRAAKLSGKMTPIIESVLTDHMEAINSYYSNLIEGNSTHPREVRKAIDGLYSDDPVKRDLQLESIAHIGVQRSLRAHDFADLELYTPETLCGIHKEFYSHLPDSLRVVRGNDKHEMVMPGELRQTEVDVGRHQPPPHDELPTYLGRLQQAYGFNVVSGERRLIAIMASHHRLLWIHPFLDGNGRVARLHTDLLLRTAGVGATGVWCLSRGLARSPIEYKGALARADFAREGDRDGKGGLSERRLIDFCMYMFKTAIDQVDLISGLLDLDGMLGRMASYVNHRNSGLIPGVDSIKPEAIKLLERAFILGEFPRDQMDTISGLGLSVTRKLVQQMKEEGLLTETSSRSPLRWAIPEHAEGYFLPQLSPS